MTSLFRGYQTNLNLTVDQSFATLKIRDHSGHKGYEMVFCFQNCSDLLWKKNWSSDGEKLLKFEAEGLQKKLEQFIRTVKSQNNFWNGMLF